MPTFIADAMRRAKKIHICNECGREIEYGETYEHVFAVYGAERNIFKTCTDCLSVRNVFFCNNWIFGSIWEHIYSHIIDCDGSIDSSAIAKLTPLARKDICDIIEDVWWG